jgi:hypothetical protein
VTDVAILGQMGGSGRSATRGHHLVKRAAHKELGIEFPAEFTRPAGACVETIDDGWIDVFQAGRLLGGPERIGPVCESESQYSASADLLVC